ILLFFLSHSSLAQLTAYAAPAGLQPSGDYEVTVNGKNVFVYHSPVPAAYCAFDFIGNADIIIKANRDIKWVDVRPLSANIRVSFKDSVIRLRLAKPQQLSIEVNGSIKMPLFLFANAPELSRPPKTDKNVIYFEGGKIHYPGIINVSSNQTVYIEEGAVVVGVIKAKGATNVKILGRGVLDGTYNIRFNDSLIKNLHNDTAMLRSMKGSYQRFLEFIECSDVLIEGITLHNSTTWQVVPINCTNVRIRNIKIISDQASDDGIDIVRCKKVTITNCFIRTKDDNVVVKAHLDYPATFGVDEVSVTDCTFWNALWGNSIEIGFELNASEIKNITFRNIDIIHVEAGAAISIHNAGAGNVKNIIFDDIRIEDARQKLFDFAIFRSVYSEDGTRDPEVRRRFYLNGAWDGVLKVPADQKTYHAQFRGSVSNILLKNIRVVDGLFPFSIFYGFDTQHTINNVTIENLVVHGKKINSLAAAKLYQENTQNIQLR
ncbi:MAG TPA: glycosyl hydrolase family 28 protein, partial [Chitinophagaceae bacterium]|nr:glycosyl hydrolase family 28 protein [Chitinophagaceae bacterium]